MKIFVGSSKEKKSFAKKIVNLLRNADLEVLPWWSKDTFPGGKPTLKALLDLSENCDGAVFVFGEDDEKTVSSTLATKAISTQNKKIFLPRDNVVLEYGIFVARLGQEKTIIVREGETCIPTDLEGITLLTKRDYRYKVVENLRSAHGNSRRGTIGHRIILHLSTSLARCVGEGVIPEGWHSRAMYIGSRGAKSWADVENDTNYSGHTGIPAVASAIKEMAKKSKIADFTSFISFGPGIGLLDKAVVAALRGSDPVHYVPIDINDHLAVKAAQTLDESGGKVSVPFCIVADFEAEMGTIASIVRDHTHPKRVFMILGGTFGNIETSEDKFLKGLADSMDEDDVAILDVSIATQQYDCRSDPYSNINGLSINVKKFLAAGVERRIGTRANQVVKSLPKHVAIRSSMINSYIEKTISFEFYSTQNNQPTLLHFRRYDFNSFETHLGNQGFQVISSTSVGESDKPLHRGVFFIKKALVMNTTSSSRHSVGATSLWKETGTT